MSARALSYRQIVMNAPRHVAVACGRPIAGTARMRAGMLAWVLVSVLTCLLCGCRSVPYAQATADGQALVCAAGERAMQHDALYFGRRRPDGGIVSDEAWQAFVDDIVTPRFPDGFTVVAASGQWRGGDGAIVREPSQILIVLDTGDAASMRAIEEIIAEYKRRFAQESVLRERSWSCASF